MVKSRNKEGIPERVTKKDLRAALDAYKDCMSRKCLAEKEKAGDNLYRLAKALLKHNGFYTYREAVIESWGREDGARPEPDDFE